MTTNPKPVALSPERTTLLGFLESFRHDVATLPDPELVEKLHSADNLIFDTFVKVDQNGPRTCADCGASTYGEKFCTWCAKG